MKLQGVEVSGVYVETVVIPRPPTYRTVKNADGQDVVEEVQNDHVFRLQAVLDYSDFEKMVPEPVPPSTLSRTPNGPVAGKNVEDPKYKKERTEWAIKKFNWGFLKSIAATEGLEWSQVNMEDDSTWNLYEDEFKKAGFSSVEVGRLFNGFQIANGLNEAKMEEARKRFLLRQQGR